MEGIKILYFIVCLSVAFSVRNATRVLKGVSFSEMSLYQPIFYENEYFFKCLTSNSDKILPYSYVNDDFCDCDDGSDEPGTSACAPIGEFYCPNAGFKPRKISSIFVNDAVCDCCDGSDESVVQCPDTCKLMYLEQKSEFEKQSRIMQQGSAIRSEYVERASQLLVEAESRLAKLREILKPLKLNYEQCLEMKKLLNETFIDSNRQSSQPSTDEKQNEEYVATEEDEASDSESDIENKDRNIRAVLSKIDVNENGLLEQSELDEHAYLSEDQKKQVKDVYERILTIDDDKEFNNQLETLWQTDFENQLIAIKSYQNAVENEHRKLEDGGRLASESKEEQEVPVSEAPQPDISDLDIPESLRTRLNSVRENCESDRVEVDKIEREIGNIESNFKKDFGKDNAFLPLKGHCYSLKNNDYVYQLCPFDRVVQDIESSNEKVSLGHWSDWQNNYTAMLYENGQKCWNGPVRSAQIKVQCGLKDSLISVSEPSRCKYQFVFETPASCDAAAAAAASTTIFTEHAHEEL